MEAESVPVDLPWVYRESPIDDYTGSGYVRFDGNTPKGGAPNGHMSVSACISGLPDLYPQCISSNAPSTTLKSKDQVIINWCCGL